MKKFRLVVGQHIQNDPSGAKDADGRPISKTYRQGDIVPSEKDLVQMFNAPGSVKFQRVFQDEEEYTQSIAPAAKPTDGLEDLSVKELQRLAAEDEIDLRGAVKKDEIISAIRGSAKVVLK